MTDAAAFATATTASSEKGGGQKPDVPEKAEKALPSVKTVPSSPKVYIRKVKGKAKKDAK